MWMKKRGLWVPGGELHGIADRPHWITILIGGVSPALALAAVWISYHALQTSETTLKIGNRAYVALVSGRMQFSDYGTALTTTQANIKFGAWTSLALFSMASSALPRT